MRGARGIAWSLLVVASLVLALEPGGPARARGDDAHVTTQVDRRKVALGEEIQLTIGIEGAFEQIDGPTIADFVVTQQQSMTQLSNGARTIERVYMLRPKKAGTLTIGQVRALSNGQTVAEAPAITITVDPPTSAPPTDAATAQDTQRATKDPVTLRYGVARTHFYVGEPFPLTLELWLQAGLQYAGAEMVQQAKLDGLFVQELPDKQREVVPTSQTVNGTRFETYALATVLATPLKAGSVTIDGTTLRVTVADNNYFSSQKVLRTTQPFQLEIRDVPTTGRPPSFRPPNIGQLALSAKLTDEKGQAPARARTGQRMVLRAEVTGRGNLSGVEAPVVETVPGFDVAPLPTGSEDDVTKDASGMSGTRIFQWLVTPKAPGNLTTPALTLGYWDPDTEKFAEAKVPGQAIEVTGAPISATPSDAEALGEDVAPIIERAELAPGSHQAPAESPLYWSLMGVPLVGWALIEWRFRRGARDARNPGQRLSRGAGANAKKRLRAAEQALKDGLVKDFYGQLSRTLASYLEERANIPATGMTHDQVRGAALQAGYATDLADAVVVEMENCDFARFAPSGSASEKMREAHARVSGVIDQLDRVQPERRP